MFSRRVASLKQLRRELVYRPALRFGRKGEELTPGEVSRVGGHEVEESSFGLGVTETAKGGDLF
jgi:hypothetical protein